MNTNIIFGTWQLPTAQHICRDAVFAALQAGYRQIDTAADYDNEESVDPISRPAPFHSAKTQQRLCRNRHSLCCILFARGSLTRRLRAEGGG